MSTCATTPCGAGEPSNSSSSRRQRPAVDKSICFRCREAKSVYVVRNTTVCVACFETFVSSRLVRVIHKPLLGPGARPGRPRLQSGNLLLAVSGGAGSTTMMDLMADNDYYGRSETDVRDIKRGQKAIVWSRGCVVHVDFSAVTGLPSHAETLAALAAERQLGFVVVRAEEAFNPALRTSLRQAWPGVGVDSTEEATTGAPSAMSVDLSTPDLPLLSLPSSSSTTTPLESLNTLLAALPAPSRPALLRNILEALLNEAARELPNISHLLVGETSTREAGRVISATAAGRGWALPLELATVHTMPVNDTRSYVRIKAMKEVNLKEAAFWCRGRGIPTLNERRWDNTVPGAVRRDARGKGSVASIEALTEQFVAKLNVSHSSTVSTVNKTGNKLQFVGEECGVRCPICQNPVDPSALEWKANSALTSLPGRGAGVDQTAARASAPASLAPLLCYACLTTFTPLTAAPRDKLSSEGGVPLPLWVSESVAEREGAGAMAAAAAPPAESHVQPQVVTQNQMKAQIADFLLGEEEEE